MFCTIFWYVHKICEIERSFELPHSRKSVKSRYECLIHLILQGHRMLNLEHRLSRCEIFSIMIHWNISVSFFHLISNLDVLCMLKIWCPNRWDERIKRNCVPKSQAIYYSINRIGHWSTGGGKTGASTK